MDVVALLRSKNRCLQRFLDLSVRFSEASEKGDLSGLAGFQEQREAVLKAIELFDRKITDAVAALSDSEQTPALIDEVRKFVDRKRELVAAILAADLTIISRIEVAKNDLLKEMNTARKGRELLGKFKSGQGADGGEGLDEKL